LSLTLAGLADAGPVQKAARRPGHPDRLASIV